eukprot:TRINITY_DN4361_c0_g1_i3.p1 TRINITY_DN4361_c0_g1~~TRINITY_DN4361_c0_g1_i3.p1  ORF type:complete len:432 (+),score=23.35 TRINITY_DN4361_c0_g1_i3:601-1896(+)
MSYAAHEELGMVRATTAMCCVHHPSPLGRWPHTMRRLALYALAVGLSTPVVSGKNAGGSGGIHTPIPEPPTPEPPIPEPPTPQPPIPQPPTPEPPTPEPPTPKPKSITVVTSPPQSTPQPSKPVSGKTPAPATSAPPTPAPLTSAPGVYSPCMCFACNAHDPSGMAALQALVTAAVAHDVGIPEGQVAVGGDCAAATSACPEASCSVAVTVPEGPSADLLRLCLEQAGSGCSHLVQAGLVHATQAPSPAPPSPSPSRGDGGALTSTAAPEGLPEEEQLMVFGMPLWLALVQLTGALLLSVLLFACFYCAWLRVGKPPAEAEAKRAVVEEELWEGSETPEGGRPDLSSTGSSRSSHHEKLNHMSALTDPLLGPLVDASVTSICTSGTALKSFTAMPRRGRSRHVSYDPLAAGNNSSMAGLSPTPSGLRRVTQ